MSGRARMPTTAPSMGSALVASTTVPLMSASACGGAASRASSSSGVAVAFATRVSGRIRLEAVAEHVVAEFDAVEHDPGERLAGGASVRIGGRDGDEVAAGGLVAESSGHHAGRRVDGEPRWQVGGGPGQCVAVLVEEGGAGVHVHAVALGVVLV